ncbi:MAG: VWA domain-containing protein [Actinomycetia bacterium]|nr:VWA domain-containing protein [Actinomycetes bacterium]
MNFLSPAWFLALIGVAALVVGYLVLQRRRRAYAVRFADTDLLASVAPKRPGWRRHVPAAAAGLALVLLVIGLAKPVHEVAVAEESEIIMLNIDVSRSMEATDVDPSRLEAATAAAQEFVNELPEGVEVGLVAFSSTAQVLVPPTTNHRQVNQAISRLEPEEGTASGDAIIASLRAIDAAQVAAGVDTDERQSGDPASAAIVLLSDGDRQLGVSLEEASAAAVDQGVPVSTITFGTPDGTVTVGGEVIPVPPDPEAMELVAETTGGTAFDAQDSDELREVYSQIQGEVGFEVQQSDLWPWFVGFAFALLALGFLGSMIWTGRFL